MVSKAAGDLGNFVFFLGGGEGKFGEKYCITQSKLGKSAKSKKISQVDQYLRIYLK